MSFDFDGASGHILSTITAIDTGDWTFACWAYPRSIGESNNGMIFFVGTPGGATCQQMWFSGGAMKFEGNQASSANYASSRSNAALAANQWHCLVATFSAADNFVRLVVGDLDTPMAEVGYENQVAMTGTRATGGTQAYIGNYHTGAFTFDGRIARVLFTNARWGIGEMESYRLGAIPLL